jgi:hypothetical protein
MFQLGDQLIDWSPSDIISSVQQRAGTRQYNLSKIRIYTRNGQHEITSELFIHPGHVVKVDFNPDGCRLVVLRVCVFGKEGSLR